MKVDYDQKKVTCDCGFVEPMDTVNIQSCPHCEHLYYLPQCDCSLEFVKIPHILYNYIECYQHNLCLDPV